MRDFHCNILSRDLDTSTSDPVDILDMYDLTQRRLEARPGMLCTHYILSISGMHVIVLLPLVMQTWRVIYDNKATDLNGCDHLYACCVWKERL